MEMGKQSAVFKDPVTVGCFKRKVKVDILMWRPFPAIGGVLAG
jgi:hypothetical protein